MVVSWREYRWLVVLVWWVWGMIRQMMVLVSSFVVNQAYITSISGQNPKSQNKEQSKFITIIAIHKKNQGLANSAKCTLSIISRSECGNHGSSYILCGSDCVQVCVWSESWWTWQSLWTLGIVVHGSQVYMPWCGKQFLTDSGVDLTVC